MNAKPLAELAFSGMKVVIISEDQTRPSPVGNVVLPVLGELNALGIPDENVEIVIGRGTHRSPSR
ncbi:MAG: DUF2088 domain-containing protein [Deltaproteobacteria bacterium]|nr:DUF2088 domain-containing protein [Deltaproteobacteria bacterium]